MADDRGDNYEWIRPGLPPIRQPYPGGCVFRGVGYSAEMQWEGVQINDPSFVDQYETRTLVPLPFDDNPGRVIISLDIFRDEGLVATRNGEPVRVQISGYQSHAYLSYQRMFQMMDSGTVFLGTFALRESSFNKLGSAIYHLFPPRLPNERLTNHLVTFIGHEKKKKHRIFCFQIPPAQVALEGYISMSYTRSQICHIFNSYLLMLALFLLRLRLSLLLLLSGLHKDPSHHRHHQDPAHPYDRAQRKQPRGPRQGPVPNRQRQYSGRCIMDYTVPECLVAAEEREGIDLYEYSVCKKRLLCLERSWSNHFRRRCWGIVLGFGFIVAALDQNFKKITVDSIVADYKKSNSRIILLDYDGILLPQKMTNRTPDETAANKCSLRNRTAGLYFLSECADKKNVVFIASGNGRSLEKWFGSCPEFGFAAEHGFFMRQTRDEQWKINNLCSEFGLMQMAEPVMNLYTKATEGSYIETVCLDMAEALKDLSCAKGVNKGFVAEKIISMLTENQRQALFVMCIGYDRSEEDMFEGTADTMKRRIVDPQNLLYTCTVRQKPSKAKYYLDGSNHVLNMLKALPDASEEVSSTEEPKILPTSEES